MQMSRAVNSNVPEPMQISTALLLLRIAAALTFLYNGFSILFGAFSGPGPVRFAASHHWPLVIAYLVGLAEVGGGLAVLSGILFRFGAACIFVVMLGAIFLVHLPHGFSVSSDGMEYALTELLLAAAFLLTGPGVYSLSSWLPASLQKW
jgi:putative oxidoreductase